MPEAKCEHRGNEEARHRPAPTSLDLRRAIHSNMLSRARHGGLAFLGPFLLQLPHGIGRVASGSRARIPLPRCVLWMIAKEGCCYRRCTTLCGRTPWRIRKPRRSGAHGGTYYSLSRRRTQGRRPQSERAQAKAKLGSGVMQYRIDLNFRDRNVGRCVPWSCVPISRVEGREEERSVASSSLGWMSLLLEGAACLWQALHNRRA